MVSSHTSDGVHRCRVPFFYFFLRFKGSILLQTARIRIGKLSSSPIIPTAYWIIFKNISNTSNSHDITHIDPKIFLRIKLSDLSVNMLLAQVFGNLKYPLCGIDPQFVF